MNSFTGQNLANVTIYQNIRQTQTKIIVNREVREISPVRD